MWHRWCCTDGHRIPPQLESSVFEVSSLPVQCMPVADIDSSVDVVIHGTTVYSSSLYANEYLEVSLNASSSARPSSAASQVLSDLGSPLAQLRSWLFAPTRSPACLPVSFSLGSRLRLWRPRISGSLSYLQASRRQRRLPTASQVIINFISSSVDYSTTQKVHLSRLASGQHSLPTTPFARCSLATPSPTQPISLVYLT